MQNILRKQISADDLIVEAVMSSIITNRIKRMHEDH